MSKKKFDPYETLGLPRDASPEDVKKAYRERAMDAHPDHAGGSKESFALVALAKDVLSDEKRRAKFDQTGDVDEANPDNTHVQAFHLVMGVINSIIDGDHQGVDPLSTNLVDIAATYIGQQITEFERKKKETERKLARNERALKKFRRKSGKGPNLIANAMTTRSNAFRQFISEIESEIARHKRAIEIVREYEFDADPMTIQAFTFTSTTTTWR